MRHHGVVREDFEYLQTDVLVWCDERAQHWGVLGYHLGHASNSEQVALAALAAEVGVREEVTDGVPVEYLAAEAVGRSQGDGRLAGS